MTEIGVDLGRVSLRVVDLDSNGPNNLKSNVSSEGLSTMTDERTSFIQISIE